ncbi:CHAP domain-containing protein [Nonomuraea sp. NPDC050663]|uniref:CHAP domain-containing protein n=1 Tax=Nonomuraea sp. NPDC050663 TaxID=3364370 RepID=UPI003789E577
MAKHRRVRPTKVHYISAALTASVFAAGFGVAPAHADNGIDTTDVAALKALSPKLDLGTAAVASGVRAAAPVEGSPGKAAPSMPSVTKVLSLAKQQIGVRENSSGGGTKFQDWYSKSKRAAETVARDGGNRTAYLNAAWCAMFVSWVGEQTGGRTTIGWDAYTPTYANWFKANKRWGTTAKPGSVVFFSWSGSKSLGSIQHVGFVEKDNGDGTITTVEGNTGNGKVEQRVRPKSQVVGYGYPSYGK